MLKQRVFPRDGRAIVTLNLLAGLVALILLIFSAAYVSKAGPSIYYSHFACLYLASCLIFEVIQLSLLDSGSTRAFHSKWTLGFSWTYWLVIGVSGFICGVGYAIVAKPDCAVVGFLSSFICLPAIARLRRADRKSSVTSDGVYDLSTTSRLERKLRILFPLLRWFNRLLKLIHWVFAILFIAGAIILPLQYRFPNAGITVDIHIPSGQTRSLNYNCTTVASGNTTHLPTIWLEADAAHGIVDFLGLQHYLAVTHGRNSCSYDPPNFGWSEALPSNLLNWFSYFGPLLEALGQEDNDRVMVGWGDGAVNALLHTIEDALHTKALVLLDASPDGIEWFDTQRANSWTQTQMLEYRKNDLAGRITLAKIILALGIPWGLMPLLLTPSNYSAYFDPTLAPRFHAQGSKEPLWTYQYYALLQQAAGQIDTYLATTMVPASVKTYAVITNNSQPSDAASNAFYRKTKLDMANHIAGGNLSGLAWCATSDCDLGFPVEKAEWTANAIVSLGV